MRVPVIAAMLVLSTATVAAERKLDLYFVDLDIVEKNSAPHLVSVALAKDGRLQSRDLAVIPVASGGYNAIVRLVFDDGAISTLLHLDRESQAYSGRYSVFSGSEAYAGAQGHGMLKTLTGFDAAASSQGVYQVQLQVTVPELAVAAAAQ